MIPGDRRRHRERAWNACQEESLQPAHSIIATVGEIQSTEHVGVVKGSLHVLPVLLIESAIPLDSAVEPRGLPTQLIVSQSIGLEKQWRRVPSMGTRLCLVRRLARVQRRLPGQDRQAIGASGTKALGPRVVEIGMVREFPAETRPAGETGKSAAQIQRIEILQVAV